MALISYRRDPLLLLRAGDSSEEEILNFLNAHSSDQRYELTVQSGMSERAIQVRGSRDSATVIGILPETYLVFDPGVGGVAFVYDLEGLRRFGIDPSRLEELADLERTEERTD